MSISLILTLYYKTQINLPGDELDLEVGVLGLFDNGRKVKASFNFQLDSGSSDRRQLHGEAGVGGVGKLNVEELQVLVIVQLKKCTKNYLCSKVIQLNGSQCSPWQS